jgi:hypothetical protein
MKKLITVLFIFIIINLAGLDLTLKNGEKISGKLILNKKDSYYVTKDKELLIIHHDIVDKVRPEDNELDMLFSISKQKINLKSFPIVKIYNSKFINGHLLTENEKKQYIRPNLNLLPIGIGFGILGYENLRVANEISDLIKDLEKNDLDIPKSLKKDRNRKLTYGWTFVAISVVDIIISLDRVELYADDAIVGMKVNF